MSPAVSSARPAVSEHRTWWNSLQHFGLLLGPAQVADFGEAGLPALKPWRADQLRRELNRFDAGDLPPGQFVAWVLEAICALGGVEGTGAWSRGAQVSTDWSRPLVTGESLRPRHLWTGPQLARLPVFFDERGSRLGVHRGRKTVSDCLQWLRAAGQELALLTNGRQWRLLFAGLDFDAACESDVDLWFEEGEPGPQLEALRRLLSPAALGLTAPGEVSPLLAAIHASRRGQSELSAALGERVREAVEILVRSHGPALAEARLTDAGALVYRAAVRVVMRLVVILFAESRSDLLPRDHPIYAEAYGLASFFAQLDRTRPERLRHRFAAWPRILALFRLIHEGSHHEALQLPAYGGELFAPGDAASDHPLERALHVFETACFAGGTLEIASDALVHRILALLTRTRVKVRQRRAATLTVVPVDFADLSSEYIGILYEGLLDYELKTAPPDDPILFLAVGKQPALPLSRLEAMSDKQVKDLFAKLKDTRKPSDEETEGGEDAEDEQEEDREAGDEPATEGEQETEAETEPDLEGQLDDSPREAGRGRALAWTRRAAEIAGLVKKPRGKLTPEKRQAHENQLEAAARTLASQIVHPGQWYLVRWGGTRKGAGTFYTRPQIAVPLVQRTLRPLAYDPPAGDNGEPDRDAPAERWTPKRPEEILALKVCDPACGSGTFPLAALRFLTDAVYAALFHHGRLAGDLGRTLDEILGILPAGSEPQLGALRLPSRPDAPDFEDRLKAYLRRYVAERCIYGVDLDPLAVELCRLALWIETLDRELPFSFLRHKIRTGNSLIGCWFDRFQHYPVLAWEREAGDKGHANGVHFADGELTKAIRTRSGNVKIQDADTVRRDLLEVLDHRPLFSEERQEDAAGVHDRARAALEAIHALPVHDLEGRRRRYEELRGSADWRRLQDAFDLWCALWFWQAQAIGEAPLPSEFSEPASAAQTVARKLRQTESLYRFFHWELEFPEVFHGEGAGFDALLGNPPWETLQPSSKEFFSNIDPLYRTYGKQEALRHQTAFFQQSRDVEQSWLAYNGTFKGWSTWISHAAFPFGDPADEEAGGTRLPLAKGAHNAELHRRWREARQRSRGYSDRKHPFRYQGSGKAYTYKLFLELGHALLRPRGRLGFLAPSGLYSDHGTQALRALFLDRCRWEWLFGFENRDKIFDIHRSFKFNSVIVEKGGATEAIRTAFMRRRLEDWAEAERHATPYGCPQILRFSPNSRALLEIQSDRDLEVLDAIYANSVLLGDKGPDGWGIEYAQGDFNMTSDSKLFPPRHSWEERGYRPDEYSRWLKGDWQPRSPTSAAPPGAKRVELPEGIILSRDGQNWIDEQRVEDVALPLYQGVMISHLNPFAACHVRGVGRNVVWEPADLTKPRALTSQYLIGVTDLTASQKFVSGPKVGYRRNARTTDTRTVLATVLPAFPSGDSLFLYVPEQDHLQIALYVSTVLSSLVYDFQVRLRLGGTNLSDFVMAETGLPRRSRAKALEPLVSKTTASLCYPWSSSASEWQELAPPFHPAWKENWAISRSERLRLLSMLGAVCAALYGITLEDLDWILRYVDHPKDATMNRDFTRRLSPTVFWRVGKDEDPELRHTVLTLVAFHDLQQRINDCAGDRDKGIQVFLTQNGGEGWMLPDKLRLKDYGLGHDARADRPQPVASRLGPRFYDWQLAQDPAESWAECKLHARNLLGPDSFRQLMEEIVGRGRPADARMVAERPEAAYRAEGQHRLFPGEPTLFGDPMIDAPKSKKNP